MVKKAGFKRVIVTLGGRDTNEIKKLLRVKI